uniref:Core shell protein Gag P30 domain-containing protein n=1 Tax=Falco tinnunculus TaxID=100819 RepID=A0A8C4UZT5_FALTI
MGGKQSGGIVKKSPLGCVLAHWKEIGGLSDGSVNKKTLIKYCNHWWPLYKLDDGEKWSFNGTLNYNTLVQLMLFLRREEKWDEVAYADMFFTLQNHPEYQINCRLITPQDPMVSGSEKESKKGGKEKLRCCSACSIGHRCTKLEKTKNPGVEDLPEYYKPPVQAQQRESDDSDLGIPPNRPVSSHTKSKREHVATQTPLGEAVGPYRRPILIRVPLSLSDLTVWKKMAENYRNDPVGVSKCLNFMIKQHDLDWNDIQLLLHCMTETERQLILKKAEDLASGQLKSRGEDVKEHFPLQDPHWDCNNRDHRELLKAYRDWVVKGMEQAIPKTINWLSLHAVKQGPEETPSEFLNRLRDAMRNTSLDPWSEIGIQQLVSLFVAQSATDIQRNLKKLGPAKSRDLETLLEEAWRTFNNREKQDQIKTMQMLRAALQEIKGVREFRKPLERDQCAWCKQRGHWKNECPERWKGRGRIHT